MPLHRSPDPGRRVGDGERLPTSCPATVRVNFEGIAVEQGLRDESRRELTGVDDIGKVKNPRGLTLNLQDEQTPTQGTFLRGLLRVRCIPFRWTRALSSPPLSIVLLNQMMNKVCVVEDVQVLLVDWR